MIALALALLLAAPPCPYAARLLTVVDGDTVDLEIGLGLDVYVRRRARLAGIDAPELTDPAPIERARAHLAKHRLGALLADRPLHVVSGRPDKYGRLLATIYAGTSTTSANAILLREGLARPYDGGPR